MRRSTHQLRNRIFLAFILLSGLSLITLTSVISYRTTAYLTENTLSNLENTSRLMDTQLSSIINQYKNISDGILGNTYLHAVLEESDDLSSVQREWLDTFAKNLTSFEYIDNAMIIDVHNRIYQAGPFTTVSIDPEQILDNPIIRNVYETEGRNQWHIVNYDMFKVFDIEQPYLYISRKMRNLDRPWVVSGYSVLQVDTDIFLPITESLSFQEGMIVQILLDDTSIVYDPESKRWIFSPQQSELAKINSIIEDEGTRYTGQMSLLGTEYLVSALHDLQTGFSLVTWIPEQTIRQPLADTQAYSLLIFLGTVVLILLLGIVFSSQISRPIEELSDLMRRFGEGEIELTSLEQGSGELLLLQKQFNQMAGRIQDLMIRSEEDNEEKRELEMRMLRYQINPHFLYNFLDSLNWLALESRQRRLASLITALARYYRLGLMSTKEVITLKEELEYTQYYLMMVQFRQGDRFTYRIECPPELGKNKMLKVGLQPIVENAIKHGFLSEVPEGESEQFYITIECLLQDGIVCVKIHDNGVGIEQKSLEELEGRLKHSGSVSMDSSSSLGLSNVNRRIKLHFGASYGVSLRSEGAMRGTTVLITLPHVDHIDQ